MTISSVGYRDSIGWSAWAATTKQHGADYGIVGDDDLELTLLTPTTGIVRVAGGVAYGKGVTDTLNAPVDVSGLTAPNTWYTICARRDWSGGPGNETTSIVALAGGATPAISVDRKVGVGDVDDQPIWLVHRGASQLDDKIDLRCWWGNGGLEAASALALGYLDRPGSVVRVKGEMYRRPPGTSTWVSNDATVYGSNVLGIVPVEHGGTGANSADAARSSLGVYSKTEADRLGSTGLDPNTIMRRGAQNQTHVGDPTQPTHAVNLRSVEKAVSGIWPAQGSRSVRLRRADTGNFSPGSMVGLIGGSWAAPAGKWVVAWMVKLTCTTEAIAHLRGMIGSQIVTDDESWTVGPHLWPSPTIITPYNHPGGTLSLTLRAQVAAGTATAGPGSQIAAWWEGPL